MIIVLSYFRKGFGRDKYVRRRQKVKGRCKVNKERIEEAKQLRVEYSQGWSRDYDMHRL